MSYRFLQVMSNHSIEGLLKQLFYSALLDKAPSTRITGYFRIRNFFFPDSKMSLSTHSVFKSSSPVNTHPMISGSRPTHCAAILVYCLVRDWTRFATSIVSRFTVRMLLDLLWIYFFFNSGEQIQNYPDSLYPVQSCYPVVSWCVQLTPRVPECVMYSVRHDFCHSGAKFYV